ncbi:hypothetical protein [Paenibacillus camerounensis]|uniref:hypothetical protein n=1 Tax=Paenibacillus camerounensis TaxID=1243663 RepID=UPI0005A6C5C3|nr:hypothetical protein [Paenibacillus camerounensis]
MNTPASDIIRASGISRTFGSGNSAVTVLRDIDLALPAGRQADCLQGQIRIRQDRAGQSAWCPGSADKRQHSV